MRTGLDSTEVIRQPTFMELLYLSAWLDAQREYYLREFWGTSNQAKFIE